MGLLDFGTVAEEGVKGPYANFGAAMTALRADASPSDGDIYQLTAGDLFVARLTSHASGGILIPAELDANFTIGSVASNASGDAYWTSSDDWTPADGRGFDDSATSGGGVVGDASGGGVRLTSGAVSGGARIRFTPTSTTNSMLLMYRVAAVTGDVPRATGWSIFQGTYVLRVVASAGSAGAPRIVDSGGTTELGGVAGSLTSSVVGDYVWQVLDSSAARALSRVLTSDQAGGQVVERDDLAQDATKDYIQIVATYQDATQHEVDISDLWYIHIS
jgi:hypothetical protein